MKNYILLTAILLFGIFAIYAQNNSISDNSQPLMQENSALEQHFYKHEIGVSCGLFAAPLLIPLPYLPCVIPTFNFDYHYNFNKKHSIGVSYSMSTDFPYPLSQWLNKNYVDEYPDSKNSFTSSIFNSLQMGYRINFLKAGKFTFYSSFFAGVNLVYYDIKNKENSDFKILPSLHITPIGFTYGVQNSLNFEVGIGTRGLLIIGYRYHFNK